MERVPTKNLLCVGNLMFLELMKTFQVRSKLTGVFITYWGVLNSYKEVYEPWLVVGLYVPDI